MNILIISGSTRTGRRSHQVAIELQRRFIASGCPATHVIDLATYGLPVLEEQYEPGTNRINGLDDMQRRLDQADAMVFLSPEYHGSYSGALKNAVDYFTAEFKKKPIGVAAVGSGRLGGINASVAMQHLVLSLGAYPMPYKLLVSNVQHAFDENGALTDEPLAKGMDRFVQELVWLTGAISDKKQKDKHG